MLLQVIVFPYLFLLFVLPQVLLDVEIGAGRHTGTASAAGDIGATKTAVKAVSRGGVAIGTSTKILFRTDIGVIVGAVIEIVGYKNKGAGRKEEGIIGGIRKNVGKKGGICAPRFAL